MILLIRSRPCTYLGEFYCISITDWDNMDDRNRVQDICGRYRIKHLWRINRWPRIDIAEETYNELRQHEKLRAYCLRNHIADLKRLMGKWEKRRLG